MKINKLYLISILCFLLLPIVFAEDGDTASGVSSFLWGNLINSVTPVFDFFKDLLGTLYIFSIYIIFIILVILFYVFIIALVAAPIKTYPYWIRYYNLVKILFKITK